MVGRLWQRRLRNIRRILGGGIARSEEGFGLIEVMVSVGVFAIFSIAFLTTMLANAEGQILAQHRVHAEELATQKIEEARALPYVNVGTPSGNPTGTIPASTTATIGSISYTVETTVDYVDDPLPTGFQSFANYKKVTVVIKKNSLKYASLTTNIAPPTPPQLNKSVVKVIVVDYGTNQPVQGATVNLNNGPSSPESDTTASDGSTIFPNLTPNPSSGATANYDVTVSYAGYQTLPDDLPNATAAHFAVAVSQVRVTTIRIFKPVTLTLRAVDGTGTLMNVAGNFYVTSIRQSATVGFTGGTTTITTLNGEAIIPGLQYEVGASSGTQFGGDQATIIPTAYPTNTAATFNIVMTNFAATATLTVNIKDAVSHANQNNALVVISDGPGNVYILGRTNSSGNFAASVPTSSTVAYTITYPPQGTHALQEATSNVTANKTVNLNV